MHILISHDVQSNFTIINGEPYTKKTILHEEIVKGGTLVYKMK